MKGMGREIVFALYALAAKESDRSLAYLQAARKKVFEENLDLILVINTDGTIVEANPSAEKNLGLNSDKITGANIYDVFPGTSPDSRHFLEELKAGSKNLSLELSLSGTEYMVNLSPLKNQAKEDVVLLIARDISEQKAHRNETIKASKLAAMGELSVGVANDINNLTNGLINYTQILSDEIEETAGNNNQSLELLANVIKESERISQIVQQLLFFNTNNTGSKEAVKINKIVEDSLALTQHQFRHDAIKVTVKFPETVPSVQINVQEMQHIFLNILSNARYALNQRYSGKDPQKCIEIKGEIKTRNGHHYLQVVCTDFGMGINPNIVSKVLEPFFSTKPEGIGTGLGLSICRSIVEDNNGTLEIESILDHHTSIIIELPIVV